MKRTVLKMGIMLLVCCLLAGCGAEPECQHQWTEADCLNAKSCTLCGQTEGEALGHDWQEASCAKAGHCSRCGEERGEALEHSLGGWILGDGDMYRICSVCESEEHEALDYEAFAMQAIPGHWHIFRCIENDEYFFAEEQPTDRPDMEIIFNEDGSFIARGFESGNGEGSWNFDRAEYHQSVKEHELYLRMEMDGSEAFAGAYFSFTPAGSRFAVEDYNGKSIELRRSHGELISQYLCGSWAACVENNVYCIDFFEDRSFSTEAEGGISGFWQPRPVSTKNHFNEATILLNYEKDGKQITQEMTLQSFNPEYDQQLLKDSMNLVYISDDLYLPFSLDAEEPLTRALENAAAAPLGTWTSIDYMVGSSNGDESGLSTDYSITFNEDGSFEAALHEDFQGTWQLESMDMEDGVRYRYGISAPGAGEYSYFTVSENGRAYIYIQNRDMSLNYNLKKLDEQAIAERNELIENAPTMIVGKWIDPEGSALAAEFREDGSFTLTLESGEQCECSWAFNTMSEYNGYYSYHYDMESDFMLYSQHLFGDDLDLSALGLDGFEMSDAEGNTVSAEDLTHPEEYALLLLVRDGQSSLEINSYLAQGSMVRAD